MRAYVKHLSLFVPLVALCIWALLVQETCSAGRAAESMLRSENTRAADARELPRSRR